MIFGLPILRLDYIGDSSVQKQISMLEEAITRWGEADVDNMLNICKRILNFQRSEGICNASYLAQFLEALVQIDRRDFITYVRNIEEILPKLRNSITLSNGYLTLAQLYQVMCKWDQSIEMFTKAAKSFEEINCKEGELMALTSLCGLNLVLGNTAEAINGLEKIRNQIEFCDNEFLDLKYHLVLAESKRIMHPDECLENIEEGKRIAERIPWMPLLSELLYIERRVLTDLGRITNEKSRKLDNQIDNLNLKLSNISAYIRMRIPVINRLLNAGNFVESEKGYLELLKKTEDLADHSLMDRILNNLAVTKWYQGEWSASRSYYERGLDLARKIGNFNSVLLYQTNIAELLMSEGKTIGRKAYCCLCILMVSDTNHVLVDV